MKVSGNLIFLYFYRRFFDWSVLLPVMVFWVPASASPPWQKYLIFSIFGLICFLGLIAGISPSKFQKKTPNNMGVVEFRGHHPDCGNFSGHVIQLAGGTYCPGCSGLVIGAIISLSGTLIYLTRGLSYDGMIIFWLGFTGALLGLIHNRLFKRRIGFLNLSMNVIFVVGAFMLLLGIEKINSNLLIELYLLILIPNWIITRILSSQREHKRICELCNLKKCKFLSYS